jgi:predicted  nucleic acid-binding Zn-ribbon protein
MNADLDQLVLLQAIDLELKHLRAVLAEAPKRVAAAEAARAKAAQALAAAQKALATEETLRRRQESDIADRRQKIARLRKQMDAATSAAQIAALEHEISFAEQAIQKLEDEELESLERSEKAEAEKTSAQALLERTSAGLATEQKRAEDVRDHNTAAIAAREQERTAVRAGIGESPLANYDRVAKSRGTGLSEVVDHKCSACQMMLRPQRWNDLTGRDHRDDIFTCESCGRMLFWDPRRDAPGDWPAGDRLAKAKTAEARG